MASLVSSVAACACSAVSCPDQPVHLPRRLRRAIGVEGAWQWRPSASEEPQHLDGSSERGSGVLVHGGAAAACALDPEEGDGNQSFLPYAVSLVSSRIVPREASFPHEETTSSLCALSHQ
jgi:hypothetical protein